MEKVKFWVSTGPFNEIYVYEDVSEEEYRILKDNADICGGELENCEGLSELCARIIEDACYDMQDGVIETDEYQENYDLYVRWPDLSDE